MYRPAHDRPAGNEIGPIELVVLQGTSLCNLDCSYCYLPRESRRSRTVMALEDVEVFFSKILSSRYLGDSLRVIWHSGEPTVLGPRYYATAMDAILGLRNAMRGRRPAITFDIQTNAVLIDESWCRLLLDYQGVLRIGVSCDGPAFLHDRHRKNWAGQPTHQRTLAGMTLLAESGLKFSVIAVVTPDGLDHPEALLEFFAPFSASIEEFRFNLYDELNLATDDIPALEALAGRYAGFLRRLLKASDRAGPGPRPPAIRNFAAFYEMLFDADGRGGHDARSMSKPFKAISIQADGDVSTFYAGLTRDESRDLYGDGKGLIVGNLLHQDLDEIAAAEKLRRIGQDFETSHGACEARCGYYGLCSGGYNLIKHKRFGRFDATWTPECFMHVQVFARTLLEELNSARPDCPDVPGASPGDPQAAGSVPRS